jgi:hypothetical protein
VLWRLIAHNSSGLGSGDDLLPLGGRQLLDNGCDGGGTRDILLGAFGEVDVVAPVIV